MFIEKPRTPKEQIAYSANVLALKKTLKKMHNIDGISTVNIRKKMRPFCRTSTIGVSTDMFTLCLKYSRRWFTVYFIEKNSAGLSLFQIVNNFSHTYDFFVWAKTDKELLTKLIVKYDLFKIDSNENAVRTN